MQRFDYGSTRVWRRWIGLLLLGLVLGGCGERLAARRAQAELPLDFAAKLPTGWEAIDTWHEINIDDDSAMEFLLFFRFDVGQIGAVIYDGQINGVGQARPQENSASPTANVEPSALSQGFGYYRPYRLLPSSWIFPIGGDPGHGIVAPPGAEGTILVIPVPFPARENDDDEVEEVPAMELVLRGGISHLTFVWWGDTETGYGVTQLVAQGGFLGIDWDEWLAEPQPIQTITGLEPLSDYRIRSQICRIIDYTRLDAANATANVAAQDEVPLSERDYLDSTSPTVEEPGQTRGPIVFQQSNRGLSFCRQPIPQHPFYPEGVVLAYLQRPVGEERTLTTLVTSDTSVAQIDADGTLTQLADERIDDMATYRTIPAPVDNVPGAEFAPTTLVCVELSTQTEPLRQRWLVFTLRYLSPDLETGLPDRWAIAGVRFEPQPVTPPERRYCETVLARNAPSP